MGVRSMCVAHEALRWQGTRVCPLAAPIAGARQLHLAVGPNQITDRMRGEVTLQCLAPIRDYTALPFRMSAERRKRVLERVVRQPLAREPGPE